MGAEQALTGGVPLPPISLGLQSGAQLDGRASIAPRPVINIPVQPFAFGGVSNAGVDTPMQTSGSIAGVPFNIPMPLIFGAGLVALFFMVRK